MKTNKVKVFVYGTLMSGRSNHSFLAAQTSIGLAVLRGYEMYQVRSYPGIIKSKSETIKGEVYEIDIPTLKRLDKLEGEGFLYRRVEDTAVCGGENHQVFTYVWLGSIEGCEKISFNDMPWNPVKVRRDNLYD